MTAGLGAGAEDHHPQRVLVCQHPIPHRGQRHRGGAQPVISDPSNSAVGVPVSASNSM